MDYAIGIDLGGSSVKSLAASADGQHHFKKQLDFDASERMSWAEQICNLVREICGEVGSPLCRIGLSAPGLAAKNHRSIANMPGRLQGLEGLDWTEFLNSKTTIPVLNDAHAALLGEAWTGAARPYPNVIMLTLGTGVGGAAMVDGRLLQGAIGRAGHLGHVCLDPDGPPDICRMPGSLEMAIGNSTIQQRSHGRYQSTHDLVAAHLRGEKEATDVWLESVRYLACAIGSFINVLDPEAVVVGGGIARSGAALFDPLRRYVDEVEWQPGGHKAKIVPAELGEYAGAFGAAHYAMTYQP